MDNNIFINKSISDLSFDNIVNNNSDIKLIDNIIDPNRIFLEDTEYSEIYGLLKYQEDIIHSFSLLYKQNIKRDYLLDATATSFIQTKINDLDKKDLILEDTDSSKGYLSNLIMMRGSSPATRAADCKSATKKHRTFESYLPH